MRRKLLAGTGWSLLAAVLLVAVVLAGWEPFFAQQPGPPAPQRAYSAEIVRDEWGVPHIHGKTDPDVAFGVAWAHAEDDFATLQDVVAMTRGRFGAVAGTEGATVDYVYHLFGARAQAQRLYPGLPAETRALLDAYASGLNLYAKRHPGEIKLARLFPVNGEDIATGFALRQPFFAAIDRVLGPLVEGKDPVRDYGPPLDGKPAPSLGEGGGDSLPLPLPMGEDGALAGSNAFAIAPQRSNDGVTRLVSNSHQPYRGGVAWYELVIESDEGWHFAGATFPGSPYPFLGHNEHLGWTNTVNRPDLADVYKLVLSDDGATYRLDGKWLPLERKRVWLPVRFGPFVLPVLKTVARSAHGPVIENARGAFALRYAGMDTIDSLTEYYRLTKATTFAEWQAALRMQGVPATNFVYADKAGNIAFVYNARFPGRPSTGSGPGVDWRGVLPGDRSDLIWQKPAPWSVVPRVINPASGFVFNSNNTPFVAAGQGSELDPKAFDPVLGIELDMTNRARRAVRLLSEPGPIGRARLEAIKYDTGWDNAGYVKWTLDGIAALDLREEPELAKAQALLARWDWTSDGRGPADALATMVLKPVMSATYGHRKPPSPREVLTEAVAHLTKWFGRIDPPLGEVIRIRQGTVDLPADGGGDTLRAATTWNVDPDGRLSIKHGDSFIMFVEWPRDGPVRSQSIQPYGAATTRPASPHYADQADLFVRHGLKPVHFTRAEVAAHAVTRKVVTNR